jgi:hypothetical protein
VVDFLKEFVEAFPTQKNWCTDEMGQGITIQCVTKPRWLRCSAP